MLIFCESVTPWKSLEQSLLFTKFGKQIPLMLSSFAIWSLLVLESPVLHVHNVYSGKFFSQVSFEDCHKHQLGQIPQNGQSTSMISPLLNVLVLQLEYRLLDQCIHRKLHENQICDKQRNTKSSRPWEKNLGVHFGGENLQRSVLLIRNLSLVLWLYTGNIHFIYIYPLKLTAKWEKVRIRVI